MNSQVQAVPPILSHEELDRELFVLFDVTGQGYIESRDFETIGRAMGWKADQSK